MEGTFQRGKLKKGAIKSVSSASVRDVLLQAGCLFGAFIDCFQHIFEVLNFPSTETTQQHRNGRSKCSGVALGRLHLCQEHLNFASATVLVSKIAESSLSGFLYIF